MCVNTWETKHRTNANIVNIRGAIPIRVLNGRANMINTQVSVDLGKALKWGQLYLLNITKNKNTRRVEGKKRKTKQK